MAGVCFSISQGQIKIYNINITESDKMATVLAINKC